MFRRSAYNTLGIFTIALLATQRPAHSEITTKELRTIERLLIKGDQLVRQKPALFAQWIKLPQLSLLSEGAYLLHFDPLVTVKINDSLFGGSFLVGPRDPKNPERVGLLANNSSLDRKSILQFFLPMVGQQLSTYYEIQRRHPQRSAVDRNFHQRDCQTVILNDQPTNLPYDIYINLGLSITGPGLAEPLRYFDEQPRLNYPHVVSTYEIALSREYEDTRRNSVFSSTTLNPIVWQPSRESSRYWQIENSDRWSAYLLSASDSKFSLRVDLGPDGNPLPREMDESILARFMTPASEQLWTKGVRGISRTYPTPRHLSNQLMLSPHLTIYFYDHNRSQPEQSWTTPLVGKNGFLRHPAAKTSGAGFEILEFSEPHAAFID